MYEPVECRYGKDVCTGTTVGKKSYAVVVKSTNDLMTGDQVKEKVMKYVKPDVKVCVKAVRKTKNEIVIETVSEKERKMLYECGKYESAGLKVQMPRRIGPKILV